VKVSISSLIVPSLKRGSSPYATVPVVFPMDISIGAPPKVAGGANTLPVPVAAYIIG
jgi:hypothetical protein